MIAYSAFLCVFNTVFEMKLGIDALQIICDRAGRLLHVCRAARCSLRYQRAFKPEENVDFTTEHRITAAWDAASLLGLIQNLNS